MKKKLKEAMESKREWGKGSVDLTGKSNKRKRRREGERASEGREKTKPKGL